MDDIVVKIMNSDNWPCIDLPENLVLLNELADENFSTQTLSGMLSALLMYHQIVEAMCIHLLEDCHFFIQLSIHPTTMEFNISKNKMLGCFLSELRNTVNFYKKDEFLERVTIFNDIRNEVIHKMRKNNLNVILKELKKSKSIFYEIYELYDEIQDDFCVNFHSFKKDVFAHKS